MAKKLYACSVVGFLLLFLERIAANYLLAHSFGSMSVAAFSVTFMPLIVLDALIVILSLLGMLASGDRVALFVAVLAGLLELVFIAALILFPRQVSRLLVNDPAVISVAGQYMKFTAVVLLIFTVIAAVFGRAVNVSVGLASAGIVAAFIISIAAMFLFGFMLKAPNLIPACIGFFQPVAMLFPIFAAIGKD